MLIPTHKNWPYSFGAEFSSQPNYREAVEPSRFLLGVNFVDEAFSSRPKNSSILLNNSIMAPSATHVANSQANGTTLKATAQSFHPTGTPDPSRYHTASSSEAIHSEHAYAAHNYHPLPIVFAVASGTSVWDPEVFFDRLRESLFRLTYDEYGARENIIWTFCRHIAL